MSNYIFCKDLNKKIKIGGDIFNVYKNQSINPITGKKIVPGLQTYKKIFGTYKVPGKYYNEQTGRNISIGSKTHKLIMKEKKVIADNKKLEAAEEERIYQEQVKVNEEYEREMKIKKNRTPVKITKYEPMEEEPIKVINTKKISPKKSSEEKDKVKAINDMNKNINGNTKQKVKQDAKKELKIYETKIMNKNNKSFDLYKPKLNTWNEIIHILIKRITDTNYIDISFIHVNTEINMALLNNIDPNETIENLTREFSTHYTLTKNNYRMIMNRLDDQQLAKISKEQDENSSKSDQELELVLVTNPVRKIHVEIKEKLGKKKLLKSGKMFKYYHNMDLDFSRYQIYHKVDKNKNNDPCLIHALNMSGQLTNAQIQELRLLITTELVPAKKIRQIVNHMKINIIVSDELKHVVNYMAEQKSEKTIKINLLNEHYFINDDYPMSSYSLEHYEEVKDIQNYKNIIKKNKQNKYERKNTRAKISSMRLVKFLLDNKDTYLTPVLEEVKPKVYQKENTDNLEYTESSINEIQFKAKKDLSDYDLIFFDFESVTDTTDHEAYLIRVEKYNGDLKFISRNSFRGEDCGLKFLNWINSNSILLAHNIKYDLQFIFKYLKSPQLTERNNKIMGGKVQYYNNYTHKRHTLLIRDTHMMIDVALAKFPDMFYDNEKQNKVKKEIMPYKAFNSKTVNEGTMDIDYAISFLRKDQVDGFKNNIKAWKLERGDNKFDHIEYADIYCEQDVRIMRDGYFKFREWILEITDLDIINYLTISSIGYEHTVKQGCYEGCYAFSGVIRRFIQQFVVGGRCMIANNTPIQVVKKIQDFDAVSLYPSAMSTMGFLKGTPKILNTTDYNVLKTYDGYFVEIDVTNVGIKRDFPLLTRKEENGNREFNNDIRGRILVDKTQLEDLIEFQKIEFEIIRGYYFDEDRNYKIQEVIKDLFEKRKEAKKNGNKIQETYKLLMNSIYGKTILKFIDHEIRYIDNEADAIRYIQRNIDFVSEYTIIKDSNIYRIKSIKQLDDLFTSPHVGSEILSMSKRIMNQVMCLAEDLGLHIFYQDTDSMHILDSEIETLQKAFKTKYGRELIGKDMRQFHSDFDAPYKGFVAKKGTSIVAIESTFCGKKSYYDKLFAIEEGTNKEIVYSHIRMKSIPSRCIEFVAKQDYDDDVAKLYQGLFNGDAITFDLLMDNKPKFQFNKNFTVESKTNFTRMVCFKKVDKNE